MALLNIGKLQINPLRLVLSLLTAIIFCDTCNRVRVSSKGELFLCLGQEEKIELMPLLRQHPDEDWPIQKAIIESMTIKPEAHDFNLDTTKPAVVRFMSHTGG